MSTPQLQHWQRYIVLAHIALAVLFGVIVPPWEAHDETGHYAYVNHLVTMHSLPDAFAGNTVFLDQSHQPPLYYLVVAGLTFWIDRSDQLTPQVNLFAFDGTNRRGTRILLREPGESFPWQGTILAIHAARLVSALLSGLMLAFIARTSRLLFPSLPTAALLTTAIAAFNPQVLFMAGMVNNDVMISLTGAILAYLVISIHAQTETERQQSAISPRSGRVISPFGSQRAPFIFLGVVLGLCLWSKNSGLIFIPFTGVALVCIAWRQRWRLRSFCIRCAAFALAAIAVSAPFYVSNYLRYHQWIVDRAAENVFIQAPASLIGAGFAVALRDRWLPLIFINAFRTFWGTFGWGNVQMPDVVYTVMAAMVLIGVIGFILGFRRSNGRERDSLMLLVLLGIALVLLPGYRAVFYQDPALLPGRYLMPALVAYAGIVGFGWASLFSTRPGRDLQRMLGSRLPARLSVKADVPLLGSISAVTILGLFALLTPFAWIAPAYAPPPLRQTSAADKALLTFGDIAQVLDISATTTYLADREGLRHYADVHLTWRALKTPDTDYALGISILGRDAEVLGNLNVQPARGNYPTNNWHTGDTFDDEYYVLLEKPCAQLPALGRVSVSMYEYQQVKGSSLGISLTHELQALDGAGRAVAPIIGRFRIDAPTEPIPVFWQPPIGMFDGIALRSTSIPTTVTPGTVLNVALTYEAWKSANPEGIAFVHLDDEHGQPIAQDDHAPLHGTYPTDFWQAGECVTDNFSLSIPVSATGTLQAVTGFYSPLSGERFHTGTQDDLASIGSVQVTPLR